MELILRKFFKRKLINIDEYFNPGILRVKCFHGRRPLIAAMLHSKRCITLIFIFHFHFRVVPLFDVIDVLLSRPPLFHGALRYF